MPIIAMRQVTIKAEVANGKFHQLKRKDVGAWVMGTTIYQVRLNVRDISESQAADYTLKVYGHAVLSPRHGNWPQGLDYGNCLNVQMGSFGHLGIIVHTAVQERAMYLKIATGSSASMSTTAGIGSSVTIKAGATSAKFHQLQRSDVGAWVIVKALHQVGLRVREMGEMLTAGYASKLDVDAVINPERLRAR